VEPAGRRPENRQGRCPLWDDRNRVAARAIRPRHPLLDRRDLAANAHRRPGPGSGHPPPRRPRQVCPLRGRHPSRLGRRPTGGRRATLAETPGPRTADPPRHICRTGGGQARCGRHQPRSNRSGVGRTGRMGPRPGRTHHRTRARRQALPSLVGTQGRADLQTGWTPNGRTRRPDRGHVRPGRSRRATPVRATRPRTPTTEGDHASTQFASPATPSGIEWAPLKGSLLVIEPVEVVKDITTSFGTTDAVRATVTVVDGPKAGETY